MYSSLKRLPKESQPKLNELIRLDTISNDSINVLLGVKFMREKENFLKRLKQIK